MRKLLLAFALAAFAFATPACEQSYTDKAQNADSGHRDSDVDETGKSVNDQADGGMGDNEGQTETTRSDNQ